MLTIGKLGSSRGQLQYYERQVAAGMEDYYAGRGEACGTWRGAGAEALGLPAGSPVRAGAFLALARGCSPVDGSVLRVMGSCSTVAAIDLTFSAPKSMSVLFAVGDDGAASALVAAHERAVDAAVGYLEREACFTRRGHGGAERVRGDGFIAAGYRHRMSRAGDPQLHSHVVVGNLTRSQERYTALDAHALFEHKSAAGAVYRAVLRVEVSERLGWVRWRPAGRGLFEIDGVPEGVLKHFSQRRAEIEERARELADAGAGGVSRERMQGIALATRRPKDEAVSRGDWREAARARAAEHGFGRSELAVLVTGSAERQPGPDREGLWARLSGPAGLTEKHNTFARRHALAEIAGSFAGGATFCELERATNAYLTDPSVRPIGTGAGDQPRFTTISLLACERAIMESAARRRAEQAAVVPAGMVARAIGAHDPPLNPDQATAVRELGSSGAGVRVVCALAGTGKTTMLAGLAEAYRNAGYRVIGTAPTARAARELRDSAAIPAGTMHALGGELERAGGFPPRTVLVIDEAGMAPTRITAALFAHAEQAGTKIVAVGDPGQLASVQAGGWLAALAQRHPGPELREVIRQHDPAERAALQALHDGKPAPYLEHKANAVTVHENHTAAITALVAQWDAARLEHGSRGAVMIARDNHTRQLLNHAARQRLKDTGALPQDRVVIAGTEYAVGDWIIARRNDRAVDIDNGTLATVLAINSRSHRLHVSTARGERRELAADYVARHVEHAYALTGHGAQGATVRWAGVIGRPEEFTREWAYTALSRARNTTTLHLIAEPPGDCRERAAYAPITPPIGTTDALHRLQRAMTRTETEPLALNHTQLHAALTSRVPPPPNPRIRRSRRRTSRLAPSARGPTLRP